MWNSFSSTSDATFGRSCPGSSRESSTSQTSRASPSEDPDSPAGGQALSPTLASLERSDSGEGRDLPIDPSVQLAKPSRWATAASSRSLTRLSIPAVEPDDSLRSGEQVIPVTTPMGRGSHALHVRRHRRGTRPVVTSVHREGGADAELSDRP